MPKIKTVGSRLYSFSEAEKLLGVTDCTLCRWVRSGILPVVPVKKKGEKLWQFYFRGKNLQKVFTVKCRYCGKIFQARHPLKAEYCSTKCRCAALYRIRKAEERA